MSSTSTRNSSPFSFDFFLALYRTEDDRRYKLQGLAGLPFAILSVLGSATVAMASNMPNGGSSIALAFFCLFQFFAVAFGVAASYCLARTQVGYDYRMLPTAGALQKEWELSRKWAAERIKWENHCLDWNDQSGANNFLSTANSMNLREFVELRAIEQMVGCIDANTQNNDRKAAYIHHTWSMLFGMGIMLALASVPYIWARQLSAGLAQ